MPPSAQRPSRRRDLYAEYSYRRKLGLGEMLPAIGVAVGAGLVAFYITRLLLQRTPLHVESARPEPSGRVSRWTSWRFRRAAQDTRAEASQPRA